MDPQLIPNSREVESQLERILLSAYFSSAATQSAILKLVVEKALRGEALKELEIGYACFENYDPESHKVRVNAGLVRDKLSKYYENEGKEDLVRIFLPPGAFYKPVFGYHEQADAVRKYTEGQRLISGGSREALNQAYMLMLTRNPRRPTDPICFPPLRIAIAECELLLAIMDSIFSFRESADSVGAAARRVIEKMTLLAEEEGTLAYASLIKGAAHLMRNELWEAKCCFELAVELDPNIACSVWYAVYIFATLDERQEAHKIIESKLLKEPSNAGVRLVGSLLLYADEQYGDAGLMINGASLWGAEAGSEALIDVLTGLKFVAEFIPWPGEKPTFDWLLKTYFEAATISREEWALGGGQGEPSGRFLGLGLLLVAAKEGVAEARKSAGCIRKWKYAKFLDFILAYIALGNIGRALVWYKRASKSGCFLCPWLDLLPCFAPLTHHRRFNEMRQYYSPER